MSSASTTTPAAAAAGGAVVDGVSEPFRSTAVDSSKIIEDPVMKEAYEDQVKHVRKTNKRKQTRAPTQLVCL